AWCTGRLEVIHAISLRWGFELLAGYDVIHFYLAWVEWFTFAFANVWQIQCTDGSLVKNHFFAEVTRTSPVFISGPEAFIPHEFFPYYCLFCGIGVMPGFANCFLGFIRGWGNQGDCFGP